MQLQLSQQAILKAVSVRPLLSLPVFSSFKFRIGVGTCCLIRDGNVSLVVNLEPGGVGQAVL